MCRSRLRRTLQTPAATPASVFFVDIYELAITALHDFIRTCYPERLPRHALLLGPAFSVSRDPAVRITCRLAFRTPGEYPTISLGNTKGWSRARAFSRKLLPVWALFLLFPQILLPQFSRILNLPTGPEPSPPSELTPDKLDHVARPNAPALDRINVTADERQVSESGVYHLRGHAVIELSDTILKADEIDYNEETGDAEARGHVYYENFTQNERLTCDRVEYNTDTQHGKYYNVHGYIKSRIDARPGMLTSNNPFYFEGKWAERIEDKYIVHDGMVTGCKLPHPWWTLHGPKFDVVPQKQAKAYNAWFHIKQFPIFYTPFFYKSLEKDPRESGFLTPNVGHSSLRGFMFGVGYYWAINRSYDATYRVQDFTSVGTAHTLDFRGKPNATTDFSAVIYGVWDTVRQKDGNFYSGVDAQFSGKSDLGDGWLARGNVDYLSSLAFRQQFSESFNAAIFSESVSRGSIEKYFGMDSFEIYAERLQLYQEAIPENDYVILRKLPEVSYTGRDQQVSNTVLPVWFSWDSSMGLVHRSDPTQTDQSNSAIVNENTYSTSQFMPRLDLEPEVKTAFRWDGFDLISSFTLHESYFGQSLIPGAYADNGLPANAIAGGATNRLAAEFDLDITMPTIERIYNKKTFLGDKLKHVIEPRITYKYVDGVDDFERLIRFDELETLADTDQVEFSLTNRIYAKRGDTVNEVFSWTLSQELYFDPTFGGALVSGQRNVTLDSLELTGYAFLDQPRHYSPLDSEIRVSPVNGVFIEWRADFDPLRGGLIDSGFTMDYHRKYFNFSAGNNDVRGVNLFSTNGQPQLTNQTYISPPANQYRFYAGFGNANRRGWNAGMSGVYDYRASTLQYAIMQVTYNTDCCGFTAQMRRFNIGTRDDSDYRIAFTIANVGQFGNLRKQERLF